MFNLKKNMPVKHNLKLESKDTSKDVSKDSVLPESMNVGSFHS